MCQRCGCCEWRGADGCSGGEEHCRRVSEWSALTDSQLFDRLRDLRDGVELFYPSLTLAEGLRDALLAIDLRESRTA